MTTDLTPLPRDVVIARKSSRYHVHRADGQHIGYTESEQEALALGCVERSGARVWLADEQSGALVPVDCPIDSPLARFGSQ